MKNLCGAIALWGITVLIIFDFGTRDAMAALVVVLALASAFHDRARVRRAAQRALQQVARSGSAILASSDSAAAVLDNPEQPTKNHDDSGS